MDKEKGSLPRFSQTCHYCRYSFLSNGRIHRFNRIIASASIKKHSLDPYMRENLNKSSDKSPGNRRLTEPEETKQSHRFSSVSPLPMCKHNHLEIVLPLPLVQDDHEKHGRETNTIALGGKKNESGHLFCCKYLVFRPVLRFSSPLLSLLRNRNRNIKSKEEAKRREKRKKQVQHRSREWFPLWLKSLPPRSSHSTLCVSSRHRFPMSYTFLLLLFFFAFFCRCNRNPSHVCVGSEVEGNRDTSWEST